MLNEKIQFDRPIIVIGLGRSGSTLLNQILNANPVITMLGETQFMFPKLYNDLWGSHSFLRDTPAIDWAYQWSASRPASADTPLELQHARVLSMLRGMLHQMLLGKRLSSAHGKGLRAGLVRLWHSIAGGTGAQWWGFKEIWNGVGNNRFDWELYDLLFPQAIFLHLVRNPVEFAMSNAGYAGNELTPREFSSLMQDWTDSYSYCAQRASTGRYFEVRYEDLRQSPQSTLKPLFDRLAIRWTPDSVAQLKNVRVPTVNKPALPDDYAQRIADTPGMTGIMEHFGYAVARDEGATQAPPSTLLEVPAPNDSEEIECIFDAHFDHELGSAWLIELPRFAGVADNGDTPARSPLQVFENETPLPIPHAAHDEIRLQGGGRYSHWGNLLLFSTTDNSNPNSNGRVYKFKLPKNALP